MHISFLSEVLPLDSGTVVAGTGWVNVSGEVVQILLPLISLLVLGLGVPWLLRLLKKAGLENSKLAEELLTKLVKVGINWTEAWAKSLTDKPTSASKKAEAVKYILDAAQKAGLGKVAEDKISKMIEAQLARDAAVKE